MLLFSMECVDAEFMALIEHEFYHAAQDVDAFGAPKFSKSTGRPVFVIRGHHDEQFVGVVRRYATEILRQGTALGNADRDRQAFIGEGLATWLGLGQPTATGMIAALAYLGPRGSEVRSSWWFGAKVEKDR